MDDFKTDDQEFQQWRNGGGMFRKLSCVDPIANIEIGVLVHPKSVVTANP